MDLDALAQTVAIWDDGAETHGYYPTNIGPLVAAARAVLDSEEVWWCETHDSPTGDKKIDAASRCFLVIENGGGFAYPCVFEPVAVVRVRLLAEEKL